MAERAEHLVDAGLWLIPKGGFALDMIGKAEHLCLICVNCLKLTVVMKARAHCGHCQKPLLELTPRNLPPMTYKVNLISWFYSEILEPLPITGQGYGAYGSSSNIQQEKVTPDTGQGSLSGGFTCDPGWGTMTAISPGERALMLPLMVKKHHAKESC